MATIAIGGILHESNTFSNVPTNRAAFESGYLIFGNDILDVWEESHHEIGGFIEGASTYDWDLHPTLMAAATPAGRVTDAFFNETVTELIQRIQSVPNLDGVLLALHGAMAVESYPDGDGEILRRVRRALGADFPIVSTLDHHTNVSEQMVAESTALVIYKTNPHIDQRQRGLQAAEILMRTVRGEIKPTQALAKPPMIFNIRHQYTSVEPMCSILGEAEELETRSNVLAANIAAGYPYADVHEIGPAAVVVTDNDPQLAQTEAERLSNMLWNVRDQLDINLPDAAAAVAQAIQSEAHPVILVEMGDNIGGGSPGDSTFILSELLKQKADEFVCILYAPQEVEVCIQAGVRGEVELTVGGQSDDLHGSPVPIRGRVRLIHDGCYEETEPRHGGGRYQDQGITAVVEIEGKSLIVLTSKRQVPFSLHQLFSLGIDPRQMKHIVVKAAIAYRAAYEPIAGRIIEVDTPGLTAVNPLHFTYQNVRRPIFPLEAM
ncbi:M81 family metallopeptidase [Candidatus Poribacteria bacterium]|nr:M81 family metallopeptidase [Candidatus Poribacteria bacterium]